jgi:Redoxin
MRNRLLTLALVTSVAATLAISGCKKSSSGGGSSSTAGGRSELISYPVVLGNDKITEEFGGIIGLPTSMLYARDGRKIKTVVGLISHDDLSKVIESELAKPSGTPVNPPAPGANTALRGLDGKDTTVAEQAGKVVLVNFWATWCGPCQVEIPWLIEFHEKYAAKGLVILGVAMDDEGQKVVEPWIKKEHFQVN